VTRDYEPRVGRRAYCCEHKDHEGREVAYRVFVRPDEPIPMCPRHGKMTLQGSKRYRGQEIPAA
jgi:hypothetical protein